MLKFIFGILSINIYNYITSVCPSWGAATRKGLTTPFTRWVARCCCLCAGAAYIVLLGSPTARYRGFITEGNTHRRYSTSSLPLQGNTDVASSRIMEEGIWGWIMEIYPVVEPEASDEGVEGKP